MKISLPIGYQIGDKYEVVKQLGYGSFGYVYLVENKNIIIEAEKYFSLDRDVDELKDLSEIHCIITHKIKKIFQKYNDNPTERKKNFLIKILKKEYIVQNKYRAMKTYTSEKYRDKEYYFGNYLRKENTSKTEWVCTCPKTVICTYNKNSFDKNEDYFFFFKKTVKIYYIILEYIIGFNLQQLINYYLKEKIRMDNYLLIKLIILSKDSKL